MTEYDYSPDAWERYIETQHRIARWVDGTLTQAPCNAFQPATPHIKFLEIQEEKKQRKEAKAAKERPSRDRRHSYDVRYRDPKPKYRSDTEEDEDYPKATKRQSRKTSSSHVSGSSSRRYESSPPPPLPSHHEKSSKEQRRDRSERRSSLQTTSRPRERAPEPLQGQGYVLVEKSRTTHNTPTSSRASTPTSAVATRPRSSSAAPRPSHRQANLSLDLGSPHDAYYYRYPRNSVDGVSSNTRPSSGSTTNGTFYPQQHRPVYPTPLGAPPNSAPAVMRHAPQPVRSFTMPLVGHQIGQYGHGHYSGVPVPAVSPDPSKVPQIPYSAYPSSPTKANQSTSLLKRMFTGLAINRHSTSPKPKPPPSPSKSRESANGSSGLPHGGRRILRKRSSSF